MNTRAAASQHQFDPAKGPISVTNNPSNLSELDQKAFANLMLETDPEKIQQDKLSYMGNKFKANNKDASQQIAFSDRGSNQIEGFVQRMQAQDKSRDGGRGGVA